MRIFSFFKILQFLAILGAFQAQISIPGAISCPGVVPDRPGIKSIRKSKIFAHMSNFRSYVKPCFIEISVARIFLDLGPG